MAKQVYWLNDAEWRRISFAFIFSSARTLIVSANSRFVGPSEIRSNSSRITIERSFGWNWESSSNTSSGDIGPG